MVLNSFIGIPDSRTRAYQGLTNVLFSENFANVINDPWIGGNRVFI